MGLEQSTFNISLLVKSAFFWAFTPGDRDYGVRRGVILDFNFAYVGFRAWVELACALNKVKNHCMGAEASC